MCIRDRPHINYTLILTIYTPIEVFFLPALTIFSQLLFSLGYIHHPSIITYVLWSIYTILTISAIPSCCL